MKKVGEILNEAFLLTDEEADKLLLNTNKDIIYDYHIRSNAREYIAIVLKDKYCAKMVYVSKLSFQRVYELSNQIVACVEFAMIKDY